MSDSKSKKNVYDSYRTIVSENPYNNETHNLSRQLRQYHNRWNKFLPENKDVHILDIGCGGGEFLLFLQELGFSHLEGVDISPEQVALAKSRGIKKIIIQDCLSYLKKHKDTFYLVNLQNILEHLTLEEQIDILTEISSKLDENGIVFGVCPNAKSLLGARVRFADITHQTAFTPESIRQVMQVSGLIPIYIGECGPIIHNLISLLRWIIWQFIRLLTLVILFSENADFSDRIYTQNLMFVAKRNNDSIDNRQISVSKL